jgi:hypothetical protein
MIRGKFGDKRLSIVETSDASPGGSDGVRGIVMQLVVGVKLEAYKVGGFMGSVFKRDVKAILNMGGVGFVIVFVAMRRRDAFHTVHADTNGVV